MSTAGSRNRSLGQLGQWIIGCVLGFARPSHGSLQNAPEGLSEARHSAAYWRRVDGTLKAPLDPGRSSGQETSTSIHITIKHYHHYDCDSERVCRDAETRCVHPPTNYLYGLWYRQTVGRDRRFVMTSIVSLLSVFV